MDVSLNMKNNLIQNFYIIGLNHDEVIKFVESNKEFDLSKVFLPKIISKFPPEINNYNKVIDQNVIDHCFPNNIVINKGEKYDKYINHFEFELDNNIYKYLDRYLYSKIHFTCLKFYEPITEYINLNEKITNIINSKYFKKELEIYHIPKVICFASILPFPSKLYKILKNILFYYKYNNKNEKSNIISYPIEKVIEQVIMSLPIPVMNSFDISLIFDTNFFTKEICPNPKIDFYSYEFRDYYLNKFYDLDMRDLFLYNKEENMVNIFKNILLEIPMLVFSENEKYLSKFIESFLNIISPFKYVHPYTTILPSIYYGLINSQDKFIFGIKEKYSNDFFKKNGIILNKNIFIVILYKDDKNRIQVDIKEKSFKEEGFKYITLGYNPDKKDDNNKNDNLNLNDIFSIDLPSKLKKKLLSKLKEYITKIRNDVQNKKQISENKYIFRCTIINIFHKFFINLLSGYTKYLINPNHKYFGDNIIHKLKGKNDYLSYIKEIFDYKEYLGNISKENLSFYNTFFQTRLFFNFIKEVIYPNNKIDSLKHKYLDLLTFLKKDKSKRESEQFREQYGKYKMPFGNKNIKKKLKIIISNKLNFNELENNLLNDPKNQQKALEKYSQLISKNDDKKSDFSIKYFIFPKLLFDNDFFNINYNILFYRHWINLPTDKIVRQLNEFIEKSEKEFLSKCCFTIYKNEDNNSSYFELYSNDYIEFNWLLLSSCSLWYCNTNKEKESRINKIFDILEKLEYIEEQVLYFIFYSIYKHGSAHHFIRIFENIKRFMGYYSYNDLLLLYNKLSEGNENSFNNDNDNNSKIQKRSFIDIKKYINYEIDDKIKEEIIFYNEQTCETCGNINKLNDQDITEMINKKIDKDKNIPMFKCKNCNKINFGITMNYKLSLINIKTAKEKSILKEKFNLIMPHLLYNKIKDYLIHIKDNKLDIDHIFSNTNIDILNFIFYFSLQSLPFDFLLPYENKNEQKEYFFNYDYINKKQKKKFNDLVTFNNESFTLKKKENI